MPEKYSELDFATIAIAHKFLTHEQVELAQEDVDRIADMGGESPPIEDILLKNGVLKQEEIWAIYKAQERLRKDAKNIGRKIGGYEVLGKLGEGGLGVVYKTRQLSMGRIVALKVLHDKWVGDDEFRKRFLVEARLVGRLSHQNLIQVFDVGRYKDTLYYSMEYIDGETVEAKLDNDGAMPLAEIASIILQIGRSLNYLAGKKIVHRDVKPGNIMVTRHGVAKLGDFGFVKSSLDSILSSEGEVLGTPDYISPEAALGDKDLDHRSDQYSLGATMYHMLLGRPPFGGSGSSVMDAHIQKPLPSLKQLKPGISATALRIVETMMAKSPSDRYSTYVDMFEDLEILRLSETPDEVSQQQKDNYEKIDSLKQNDFELRRKVKVMTSAIVGLVAALATALAYILLIK